MQAQVQQDDSVLHIECEKCRYAAGPEMIKCPDRAEGRCPYILGRAWDFSLDVGLWGFYLCTTLYQPEQRTVWQQFTLLPFNREFLVRKVTELEPLNLDLSSYPMPQHPASVTVLSPGEKGGVSDISEASYIVRATLFDLLARQMIGLCHARIDERLRGKLSLNQRMYFFVPGRNINQDVDGELEHRIIRAINNHKGNIKPHTAGSTFVQAMSVYKLVQGIYDVKQPDPAGWLIFLVAKDAVSQGLGQLESTGFSGKNKTFALNATHTDRLSADRQKVKGWVWNPKGLPDRFVGKLDVEIERAIMSRKKPESWDID